MPQLWASEYGKITCGNSTRCIGDGCLQLSAVDFASVKNLLEITDQDYGPYFQLSMRAGREQLQVQNYVGVIRTNSGMQFEVLPKIARHAAANDCRRLLVKMLKYLPETPFHTMQNAALKAEHMPLFELIMRYYVALVSNVVRRGIARAYVDHSGNLVCLRGKLSLHRHIRQNAYNAARFYCDYDEYEDNRPINRILHTALYYVSRNAIDQSTQQLCRELLYYFGNIPFCDDIQQDFRQIKFDRQVVHYDGALKIAGLILRGLNPLTRQGENTAISMLFPMERVFEAFVAAKLQHQFADWQIESQISGEVLIEQHAGRKMFGLKPDLALHRGDICVIADTKWKLLQQKTSRTNYNISQSDIYQLFAYSKKYLQQQQRKLVVLIYPMTDYFKKPLAPFWYVYPDEVLYVLPFDLDKELLLMDESLSLSKQTDAET